MAKNKVTVTDNSIKSGVTSDANKAICEFIWICKRIEEQRIKELSTN